MPEIKIVSDGTYFGFPVTLACDGQCEKAWGINNRPEVQLSKDEDDHAYLSDDELGNAPVDPGVYEGGHAKPRRPVMTHNKWCARECERCRMVDRGEPIELRDFSKRAYNCPSSEGIERQDFTVYWTKADDQGEFYVSAPTKDEALDIARWYVDLYMSSNGAEIKMIEGIVTPAHGGVVDYAEY